MTHLLQYTNCHNISWAHGEIFTLQFFEPPYMVLIIPNTHEGLNEKKKSPYIHFKLCHCMHCLNLRQTFHENHYSKLKTDSQSCLPNWYNPPVSENFNPLSLKYVNHNIFIVRIMHQFWILYTPLKLYTPELSLLNLTHQVKGVYF